MSAALMPVRHDWTRAEVEALFALPLNDLILRAQAALRAHHDPSHVQRSRLLNIKTGGCAENCGYCSQSAHFATDLKASKLMERDEVAAAAQAPRPTAPGASAWERHGAN